MKIIFAIFLFILSLFLIGQNLDKPFWGVHDWNGARYGNIARNFLRYGILNLQFAQIENSGPKTYGQFEYFTHYPPLLPILISISYMVFGVSEWSTRLVPLLATSGSVVLVFLIGKKLYNIKTAILAALLALLIPINLYFGKTPVHEPLVVFFISLSFLLYLYKKKALFTLVVILAHLTTWAGYFLIPAIIITTLIKRDISEFKRMLPFLFIPLVMFILHIIHIYLTTGSVYGGNLLGALLQRSSLLKEAQPLDLNFFTYIDRIRVWIFSLYSAILIGLSLIWYIYAVKNKFKEADWYLITLLIFGVTYLILFPNSAFIHNYLMMYLMPFFVLAGARACWVWKTFILCFVFIIITFLERKPFLDALNKSDADMLAVTIGREINSKTNIDDVILVLPFQFSYSADKFLRFYGDRKIIYSDDEEKYDVKVIVDQNNGKFKLLMKN